MNLRFTPSRLRGTTLGVACFTLVALTGCGGIVNFSPDGGEGGSGAVGGGGSGPSNTNNSSNSNTNVVSTGPQSTCDQFCQEFGGCLGTDDCPSFCDAFFSQGCEAQAQSLLQCIIDQAPPNCVFPEDLCSAQQSSYNQCVNAGACVTDECGFGDTECQCFGACNGLKVEQYCFNTFAGGDDATGTSVGTGPGGGGGEAPPPLDYFCNCYIEGNYVGDCSTTGNACSLESGCCQQYTFDF